MTVERRDYIALDWVANELADTLRQALATLADYLQNRDDVTQLRFCLSHIHQAYGTLRMVEFAGAALLAEEIEATAHALLAERVPEVQRDDALRALEAALARLPVYLEELQRERRDKPVALLGLINDLRAVRGEPMITESAIFSPEFPAPGPHSAAPLAMPVGELVDVAKKLRQMYQLALLNYLRGKEPRENLNYLAKVCARLAKLSAGCPPEALWKVCIALLEGLLNRSIEPAAAVKALLRQLDGQLKLLTEQGPAALRAEPPLALLKNMLYYVATSGANSRFIGEIKHAYNLAVALPAPDADDEPTLRAIRRALAGHLEDLAAALPQREGLVLRHAVKRAQDAAALLGLTRAQNVLQDTIRLLRTDQPDITAMAATLRALIGGLDDDTPLAPPPTLFNDSEEAQEQLDQAFDAILRESRNSLEQAKEAIIEFVATQWRHQCLEDVPELLAGVRGGFALAGLSRAAKVLAACEDYVRDELLGARKVPAWQVLDTLADAIASVDYYLERLSEDNEADCEAILDVAEESVAALGRSDEPAADTVPAPSGAQVIPFPGNVAEEKAEPPVLEPENAIGSAPVEDADGEERTQTDPEILSIFIEEAGEVIGVIEETLPEWRADPGAGEALMTLRRAFHTLKGSGRMVGAIAIGELAWSIENMLNRVLDGSLRTDQARVETVAAAAALAPAMVEAFERGAPFGQEPVQIVMDRAQALAREQAPALPELVPASFDPEPEAAETKAADDCDTEGDDDSVLLDIFASEALGHIETLEDYLARAGGAPAELSDDVQRALHTLKGSAFMADVTPIARIVAPVERLIKELRAARLDADPDILAMLSQSAGLFRAGLDQLARDPRQPLPGTEEFVRWVEALHYTRLAQVDDEPEAVDAISPAAMHHFLGETIELLAAVGDDVRLWRENRLGGERQHTLAGTINQVADNAEALNLNTVVDLAQGLQSLLRQGAEIARPADEFFALAGDAVESLIDMLDRLAANQQPEPYPSLLAALQEYDFTADPEDAADVDTAAVDTAAVPPIEPETDHIVDGLALADIPVLDMSDVDTIVADTAAVDTAAVDTAADPRIEPESDHTVDGMALADIPVLDIPTLDDVVEPAVPAIAEFHAEQTMSVSPEAENGLAGVEPRDVDDAFDAGVESGARYEFAPADAIHRAANHAAPLVGDELESPVDDGFEPGPVADEAGQVEQADAPSTDGVITEPLAEPAELQGLPPENTLDGNEEQADSLGAGVESGEAWPEIDAERSGQTDNRSSDEAARPTDGASFDSIAVRGTDSLEPAGNADTSAVKAELSDAPEEIAPTAAIGDVETDAGIPETIEEPASGSIDIHAEVAGNLPEAESERGDAEIAEWIDEEASDSADIREGLAGALPAIGGEPAGVARLIDGDLPEARLEETGNPAAARDESGASADAEVAELIDEWMLGLPEGQRADSFNETTQADADADSAEEWSAAIEPAFGTYLVEEADAFEAAEPEVVDLGPPPLAARIDDDQADDDASGHGNEDIPLATEVAQAPELPTQVPVAAIAHDDEVDAEILEIFLEEAGDLLEAIDEAVHGWSGERDNVLYLDDLQRLLHTLKGGARLAGLKNLGNLSHNFETMLTGAQQRARPVDDAFMGEVQAFQDELIQRVDAVKARGHAADALTGEVDSRPESAPEADGYSAPDAVSSAIGTLPTPSVEVELLSDPATVPEVIPVVAPPADRKVVPFQRQPPSAPLASPAREVEDLPEVGAPTALRRGPQEVIKISAQLLEQLVNLAGETSIARARAEEQVSEFVFALDEMEITVDRLQEQVRRLDLETDAQMLFRQEQVENEGLEGFDPLEFDRYSLLQQLSRSLLESASDLIDIKNTLADKSRDMETLLVQQSRINTELQEGLMRSRMVPFARLVPRLRRIVRQVSGELDKQVEFLVDNAEGELDRTVLERIVAPLEHMLRNAIDHGIETAADRIAAGKALGGRVVLSLAREGGEVVLTLSDDGRGVDLEAVRRKAIDRGLMAPGANLSDHEVMQFILQSGFSTARQVTQISGRGVGMDVVYSEIKQLGGNLEIDSEAGQGTRFRIRLPFTVSMNRALMVNVGGDIYAVPLNTIEGIVRVSPFELEAYYQPDAPMFEYAGQPYLMRYMGGLLRLGDKPNLEGQPMPLPVLLVRGSDHAVAVQVDGLMGSREIVVKTLGPQFGLVQGLSGATVLGDGSVVVILDLLAMIRADALQLHRDLLLGQEEVSPDRSRPLLVLVVDDSVTVRKVTSRFLERQGMEVLLAKDGVDAITLLQENERMPDVMLLDIEMPRMDGFEVASRVRHSARLAGLPIIMITSRTGEKHRERAFALGVNKYLGKPYQEMVLLEAIQELTGTAAPV